MKQPNIRRISIDSYGWRWQQLIKDNSNVICIIVDENNNQIQYLYNNSSTYFARNIPVHFSINFSINAILNWARRYKCVKSIFLITLKAKNKEDEKHLLLPLPLLERNSKRLDGVYRLDTWGSLISKANVIPWIVYLVRSISFPEESQDWSWKEKYH